MNDVLTVDLGDNISYTICRSEVDFDSLPTERRTTMPSKRRASTKKSKPTREVPAHEKAEALTAVVNKAVQTAEDYHETVNEFLASDESRDNSRSKAA